MKPGSRLISGAHGRAARAAACALPHGIDSGGAMRKPRSGGEYSDSSSQPRRASGCIETTFRYGYAIAPTTATNTTAPIASNSSSRRPNGCRRRSHQMPAATRMPPRTYPNGRPMPNPMVICQVATSQPASAQPGRTRTGRYPSRSDQPCPRASMASDSAIPPVDSTCMCPAWPSRHGAYPNAAPATAAATRVPPSWRTRAYAPKNASAATSTYITLYRNSAATGPVPIMPTGAYPSSVSENAKLYFSG